MWSDVFAHLWRGQSGLSAPDDLNLQPTETAEHWTNKATRTPRSRTDRRSCRGSGPAALREWMNTFIIRHAESTCAETKTRSKWGLPWAAKATGTCQVWQPWIRAWWGNLPFLGFPVYIKKSHLLTRKNKHWGSYWSDIKPGLFLCRNVCRTAQSRDWETIYFDPYRRNPTAKGGNFRR